jgi:multidrug efflux pump subunit AcrB
MTLGGLAAAVGLVIDDAIVVVENIVLHRDLGQSRLEAIRSALKEITVPLIGSTITPVVVFIPLVVISGVTGVFFRALAVTMTVSLLTSLALAVTWTPTLSQYFIKGAKKKSQEEESESVEESKSSSAGEPGTSAGEDDARKLLAAEEKHLSGFFLRIVNFHERWLRRALERPRMLIMKAGSRLTTSCRRAVRWPRPIASSATWNRCCGRSTR